MTDLEIALLADHPEAIAVVAEWFAREWGELGPEHDAAAYRRSLPTRADRDRPPICLLGLADGKPLATATLKFREIEYAADADFWLGSVYVREDARGRGYGRVIVAAAVSLATTKGFTPLYLYTPAKRALYEHLGWRIVGATVADGKPSTVMRYTAGVRR